MADRFYRTKLLALFADLVKTEPPDEQPTTLNDVLVKLKRKRPRKTKALDINGEGEDVTPRKKR